MAEITTQRLLLRPFSEGDLDAVAPLFATPGFMRFSSAPEGYTREQTGEFLAKVIAWQRAGRPSQFAVILRETNSMIGYCGFFNQELDGEQLVEIGYRLHPDFWNRGLATEAARAVRDFAFETLRLDHVVSFVHPDNHPSRRVAEKNGMTIEKQSVFRGYPTLVYGVRAPAS